MKNWTVGTRIVAGFLAVVLIALALGGFAYTRLNIISGSCGHIANESLPELENITRIESLARQNYAATLRYVLADDAAEKAKFLSTIQANVAAIDQLTNTLHSSITSAEDRALFDAVIRTRSEYVPAFREVCRLSNEMKNGEAVAYLRSHLDPASDRFMAAIEGQVASGRKTAGDAATTIDQSVKAARVGISIGLVTSLITAAAISFFLVRGTTRVLRRISGTLDLGATQVAAAANQVSSASQSLAEGASEQAASIEETSASLEQMSSMTSRNAENAQKANEIAKQARESAEAGAADMKHMSDAMEAIKVSSDDIAKIIKTIDEIAFQTNILALNAAVEAARAGEAGMGFAVVADEVRNLAQRSALAAKETSVKIEGAITRTAQGVEISSKVAAMLENIVVRARQVDELVSEVASASREQSQGISQVNTAVGQMDKVTQNNAASAEESASAAEQLNAQAASMKEAIDELVLLVSGSGFARKEPRSGGAKATSIRPVIHSHRQPYSQPAAAKRNGSPSFAAPKQEAAPAAGVEQRRSEIPLEGDFKDF